MAAKGEYRGRKVSDRDLGVGPVRAHADVDVFHGALAGLRCTGTQRQGSEAEREVRHAHSHSTVFGHDDVEERFTSSAGIVHLDM